MSFFKKLFRKKEPCEHEWTDAYSGLSKCRKCGMTGYKCPVCSGGDQDILGEDNWGVWDYCSYGGGADELIVRVVRCRSCGNVFTSVSGGVCGDDEDMIRQTYARYAPKDE